MSRHTNARSACAAAVSFITKESTLIQNEFVVFHKKGIAVPRATCRIANSDIITSRGGA
jgi:hypothetical protein